MEKIQKYSKNGEIEILSVMGFEKLRIKEKKNDISFDGDSSY